MQVKESIEIKLMMAFFTNFLFLSILLSAILSVCVSALTLLKVTAGGLSIKLGTIDHYPTVSVIRLFATS